jgi:hypothetical protein
VSKLKAQRAPGGKCGESDIQSALSGDEGSIQRAHQGGHGPLWQNWTRYSGLGCSPARTYTARTTCHGTVARRACKQAGAFATR